MSSVERDKPDELFAQEDEDVERLEMGFDHAEFFRLFPRVVPDGKITYDGLIVTVVWSELGQRLKVVLSDAKTREIGRLRIPYLNVALIFSGFSEDEHREFMVGFRRAFQKGGG